MALTGTAPIARGRAVPIGWWLVWAAAGTAFAVLWLFGSGWAVDYPKGSQIPAMRWVGDFMKWLVNDASFGLFSVVDLTRFIAALIDIPYWIASSLFATGFMTTAGSAGVQIVPPISWIALIGTLTLIGHWAGGWRLAALTAALMLFIALFGQWTASMVTLASIVIAVPLGVALGLLLGILCYRAPLAEKAVTPVLDLMQTVPVFAYLVPVLFLFGFGPTAAIVATIVYAMPPMTRLTIHALRAVPAEIDELGRMVIASMIGAGGLGFDVLAALRRLDFGVGLEAGFAIVALAIVLDRLSQAVASKVQSQPHRAHGGRPLPARHPYLFGAIALIAITALLGMAEAAFQTFPAAGRLSTGDFWADVIAWINVNFFTQLEAFKDFLLLNVLIPVKRLLLSLPWLGVTGVLALAGLQLGGWRLMLLTGTLSFLIAATGQWEKAMTTVYLCGIAVAIAALIGIPIGILAAEKRKLWPAVQAVIDTLQTLPSFVYLMPVVMLFRVGDFTAILAVVLYALAPAIRYTAHGLVQVDPALIEAGRAAGTTRWQLLTKIKLKLAFPEIMLGLNQTIMLALSMLVITALVGTRDLGQEVYIALAKADTGRGIVAGLAVAFIAIIADRLIAAGAKRTRARLGLL